MGVVVVRVEERQQGEEVKSSDTTKPVLFTFDPQPLQESVLSSKVAGGFLLSRKASMYLACCCTI